MLLNWHDFFIKNYDVFNKFNTVFDPVCSLCSLTFKIIICKDNITQYVSATYPWKH
jgi:hypothetical protein